ncbi:MAG: extracellular solute-binding protein [Hyphomicrobiales bacterium]|nr:extracellular solute-binding protein [Hyphomicrobiales bacterium]MCP5001541.1 extracellular solute-binding protein [Hyphomicrobiales bacterium]
MKHKTRTLLISAGIASLMCSAPAFAQGSDLTVFDWSGYEDKGFFGSYIEKHGSAPSYSFFGSVDEAFTKLRSGFSADLAHPCTDATKKWVAADLIKPIDASRLENWDKLLPEIKDIDGIMVDGEVYMVPFEWGNTGLIYRTDMITDDEISLQLLADPKYQGKIAVPDAGPSAYAMAALATGVKDYTNMTDEEFKNASDYLRSIHPNVRFYWTDAGQLDQAIASKEVVMGWGWNQSELNLIWNKTPAIMMKDVDKGIATWVCGYVHLKSSKQSDDQVYDMLNALTSKASGKYIIESWGYAHSNSEAFDAVDPELIKSYGFDKADEFFEGSLFFNAVDPKLEAKMLKEFERIKAGF